MNKLVLSAFPGIDLFGRAFEEEGFCVVRGPDLIFGGRIETFHPPAGRFDGVIGGPPCQSFSPLANLVRASGREPRHGNLIPEFERVVAEARPSWFLMENVPDAPVPAIPGYGIHHFEWDHGWVPRSDGIGESQQRRRRFSFGRRAVAAVDLRRWIAPAALEAMEACRTVTQWPVNNSAEAHGHVKRPTVTSAHQRNPRHKVGAVTSSDGGHAVRMVRYTLPEACHLQGLPEDFLAEAPFLASEKLRVVANGVPLPLGRAIARAVRAALEEGSCTTDR